MARSVFICNCDDNGVYKIGDRYVNLKEYKDPFGFYRETFTCPACQAVQDSNCGVCVLCGYDSRFISYNDTEAFAKFIEENKEKIEDIKKNYGRKY